MIFIGSDHAGYDLKEKIKNYFYDTKINFNDCGTNSNDSCDYPLIAKKVSNLVLNNVNQNVGILICGSGIGMSIVANKFKGIRASVCNDVTTSKLSRGHNDANILCIGARFANFETSKEIIATFLNTNFEGQRHFTRVNQLKEIEKFEI